MFGLAAEAAVTVAAAPRLTGRNYRPRSRSFRTEQHTGAAFAAHRACKSGVCLWSEVEEPYAECVCAVQKFVSSVKEAQLQGTRGACC